MAGKFFEPIIKFVLLIEKFNKNNIFLFLCFRNCSESNWRSELLLTNKMFIVLNEIYQNYTGPYFFSALLEIGYKIHKFGVEHIHVINGKQCFYFMPHLTT